MSTTRPDLTAPGTRWRVMRLTHPSPSLAEVREWAHRALADEHTHGTYAIIQVVNSLVSNAYKHTTSPRNTTLIRKDSSPWVRIEVEDGDRTAARIPSAPATTHFGLRLVAGLSIGWGVLPRNNGKVVWAEVALTAPVPPPHIPAQRG